MPVSTFICRDLECYWDSLSLVWSSSPSLVWPSSPSLVWSSRCLWVQFFVMLSLAEYEPKALGDCLVSKVPVTQVQKPESRSPDPTWRARHNAVFLQHHWCGIEERKGGNRQISKADWLASLPESVSFGFSEKTLSQNIKVERDQGKTPSLGLAAHSYMYTNKYNPCHTHTH